jgi:hypothetical protein
VGGIDVCRAAVVTRIGTVGAACTLRWPLWSRCPPEAGAIPLSRRPSRCSRSRLHGRQILDGDIFRGSAEGRKPQIDPCRLRS